MFLLYYIVNLINFIVYLNLNFLNKLYLNFNKFNLIFKKSFDRVTFFEKFILVLFYKNNWFFKSISNFSNYSNNINELKKKSFPLLNFFSYYNNISNNRISNLFFLKKNYIFLLKNNYLNKTNFVEFIILQKFFFIKYFNFLNKSFFKNINLFNLVKLNYLFFYFNKNNQNFRNYKFNLNYYNDWYLYLFNNFNKFEKIDFNKTDLINLKKKRFNYINNAVKSYTNAYKLSKLNLYKKNNFYSNLFNYINFNLVELNSSFFKKINFNNVFFKNIYNNLPIRFSNTSINKYINFSNISNYSFFYLRKNKIFNKSRYSRNRQLYRTGVYWCLWLNIMIVYGLYFYFYRFTFNFGYLWFGLALLIFSTIFSRVLKYKFYNLYNLFYEFVKLLTWFNLIFKNILINLKNVLINLKLNNNLNLIIFNKFNYIFYFFYKMINKIIINFNKKKDYGYVFIWKNYTSDDKSFLKYKSILNWFIQLYKVLVY
jgi:hypothetical protein